jgi:ribosomal protein S27E
MEGQGQLELLLELHDLEKTIGKKRGQGKKEAQNRIDRICSRIDSYVLKHYRRHEIPFGEFRDRTCSACGMIYPKTHVHCRPDTTVLRLCEGCGRILVDAEDGHDAEENLTGSKGVSRKASKKAPKKKPKKAPKAASKKKPAKQPKKKAAKQAKKKTVKQAKKKAVKQVKKKTAKRPKRKAKKR